MDEKKLTGYPSIDKPWLKYYSEEAINTPIPQKTVYELFQELNSEHLSDIALIYFGRKISYKHVFENVEKAKIAFLAHGVKKGDRVILFTSATPELVYAVLALCRIGAIANMISPLFTLDQIKDRINETDADVMLVLDQLYAKIQPVIGELCVKKTIIIPVYNEMSGIVKAIATIKMKKKIEYSDALIQWSDFLEKGKGIRDQADAVYEENTPLVIVYSSGTTGASKGIVLTNDGINAVISHYISPDFPMKRGDKMLQIIPTWFSTGLILSVLMPISIGLTTILEPAFSKENFAKDVKKYLPQVVLAPLSLWTYAIESKELQQADLSNMVYPFSGGELVLPRIEKIINDFLHKRNCKSVLLKGYGMCELGSTVATDSLQKNKSVSTGYPMKGVVAAAFDVETNKELKYGGRGEIRVASPAHMKEYYKNEDATKAFFYQDDNGVLWGCTGDMGYVDEDGFIYILGRMSDTFMTAEGENVYCFDVENQIFKNDNIAQCEVVGIDMGNYDVPVAHIILNKECTTPVDEIICNIHSLCKDNLPEHGIPHGYKICDAFPIRISGKRDMEKIKADRTGFVLPVDGKVKQIDI